MEKDYYNILGVDKSASQNEIKKAFREKAHKFHPDKKGGDEAKFKEINEAYQVLYDEKKRSQYDQFGSTFENAQSSGFDGFSQGNVNINMDDLGDIFGGIGDMFGFGERRENNRRTRKGADMEMILSIEFMDAVIGIEKEISFRKKIKCDRCNGNMAEPGTKIKTCDVCKGSGVEVKIQKTILGNMKINDVCAKCYGEGKIYEKKCIKCSGTGVVVDNVQIKVKIPAGINNNESIRLSEYGEAGEKGAPAGDLYLRMRINSDKHFQRDGYDVSNEAKINFSQAALGGKIEIETVQGLIKLKIPAGTQSGTFFKLKDKGIKKLNGYGKGDHFVKINIITPKSLTRKQKELLKKFDEN